MQQQPLLIRILLKVLHPRVWLTVWGGGFTLLMCFDAYGFPPFSDSWKQGVHTMAASEWTKQEYDGTETANSDCYAKQVLI